MASRIPYDYILSGWLRGTEILLLLPRRRALKKVMPKLQRTDGGIALPMLPPPRARASCHGLAALSGRAGLYVGAEGSSVVAILATLCTSVVVMEVRRDTGVYDRYEPSTPLYRHQQ